MTLDDFFGPHETAEEITVRKTNWPGASENIRSILDKFDHLQGGTPQSVDCRRVRMAAARVWVGEFGEDSTELLELAYRKAGHAGLTIATERSLINIALPLKFKKKKYYGVCEECNAYPCECEEEK